MIIYEDKTNRVLTSRFLTEFPQQKRKETELLKLVGAIVCAGNHPSGEAVTATWRGRRVPQHETGFPV